MVPDLNGHVLESGTPRSGTGVSAFDRANITVRNGTIRGYHTGVQRQARNSDVGNRIVNMKIGSMNGFGWAGPAVFMDNTVAGRPHLSPTA